jgi:hypothetical protein
MFTELLRRWSRALSMLALSLAASSTTTVQNPCELERIAWCYSLPSGWSVTLQRCLGHHKSELSPECRAIAVPCAKDETRFCSTIPGDRLLCLSENESNLSQGCKNQLDAWCWPYRRKFCDGMSWGKGLEECLQKKWAELSPACRENVQYKSQERLKK